MAFISSAFILFLVLRLRLRLRHGLALVLALYEAGFDRELVARLPHSFRSYIFTHTRNLEQHSAWPDYGYPVVGRAFAGAHAGLSGLGGHALIGEDAYPHLATALDVAGDGTTSRLDLAAVNPGRFEGLQAVFTE
jgi:hypothetical protein